MYYRKLNHVWSNCGNFLLSMHVVNFVVHSYPNGLLFVVCGKYVSWMACHMFL